MWMYQIVDMIMDCKFLISELIIPNVHLLAAIFKSQHVVNHHLEREESDKEERKFLC